MFDNLKKNNSFIVLSIGATLIGFAPVFVKWSSMSPSWILFYRMLLALPMLIFFNLIFNKSLFFKPKNRKTILYSAIASLFFSIDLIIWHWAMNITSISNATIIVNSAPIFVAIFAYLFFQEKIKRGFYKSFLITYIGIFGMIYFSNSYQSGKLIGDLVVIVAAIGYALYLLIISKLGAERPIIIIFYTTLFCSIYGLFAGIIESDYVIPEYSFDWLNFLLLAFLCQFGGQFLITAGIGKISPSLGSIGVLMQPITATILGIFFFSEFLNIYQTFFILISLVGIYQARKNSLE